MSGKIDNGGAAFPRAPFDVNYYAGDGSPGMTLRDWFAAQALVGLLVRRGAESVSAEDAYALADDMLAERKKETNNDLDRT